MTASPNVLLGIATALKYLADQHYDRGECARRLEFCRASLGRPLLPNDVLCTLAASPTHASGDPPPIGRYFGSLRGPGPEKMLDNLYESSFYTHQGARVARNCFGVLCAVGLLGSFALLRASIGVGGSTLASDEFGRIVTDVVSFFGAGAFLEAAIVYHQLYRSAERTFDRCGVLEAPGEVTEQKVFDDAAEYDRALAKSEAASGLGLSAAAEKTR